MHVEVACAQLLHGPQQPGPHAMLRAVRCALAINTCELATTTFFTGRLWSRMISSICAVPKLFTRTYFAISGM
jgi:hypothetical protein